MKQETLEPIVYNIGDNIIIINPTENQPKSFTTHKVDNNFGVVYYYQLDGKEESIGFSHIKKEEPKQDLEKEMFELEQELPKTEIDWSAFPKSTQEKVGCVEPKQETLEEVAKKFAREVSEREIFKGIELHKRINLKQGCQLGYIAGFKACEEQNKGLYSEESECVNMYLDDLNIPRKSEDYKEYSIVGRIKQLEKRYLKQMSDVESHYLSKQERLFSKEEVLEQLNLLYSMKNALVDTFTDDNDYITMKWFEQFSKLKNG